MHKILDGITKGRGGSHQEQAAKLGFRSLLPPSLFIEKTYIFKIMSIETKDEHFCALFCSSL